MNKSMLWAGRAAIGCIGIVLLVASGAPKPDPTLPTKGEVIYEKGITLVRQPASKVHTGSIHGQRMYQDNKGTWSTLNFIFNNPSDTVKVHITDTNGIAPGNSVQYVLYFKDAGAIIKGNNRFILNTANDFASPGPKFDFDFLIKVNNTDPNFNIDGTPALGGIYELSETDRTISISLFFNLYSGTPFSDIQKDYD